LTIASRDSKRKAQSSAKRALEKVKSITSEIGELKLKFGWFDVEGEDMKETLETDDGHFSVSRSILNGFSNG